MNEKGTGILIDSKDADIILVDTEGQIVYDDIGNYRYFQLGMTSARGKNIRELFCDLPENYPLLRACQRGETVEHFREVMTTGRGVKLTKTGSCYPVYDGEELVGAIEIGKFYYGKENMREIEQHSGHMFYRKNQTRYMLDDIITQDPGMMEIKSRISSIALSNANVLIYGKTGTGKELVAQAIHNSSRRYSRKFLSQNCSAIPESLLESVLFGTTKGSFTGAVDGMGLFEEAEGGTIFLDEINSISPEMQAKLLKTIESKKIRRIGSDRETHVDFRVVAAVNEDPADLIRAKRLKPDLLYRLAVVYIKLPDLMEREGDIELLTRHFIDYFNEKTHSHIAYPSKEIIEVFQNYSWPGNVRELRNVIEGAFAFAENDKIERNDIPSYILEAEPSREVRTGSDGSLKEHMTQLEREIVLEAFHRKHQNLTDAAEILGISKQLLRYKLDSYQEEKDEAEESV